MRKNFKMRFSIDKINISNGNQSLMAIPFKNTRARESKKKKEDTTKPLPIALKIVIDYGQERGPR
jgi:hypothetical protein